MGLKSRDAMFIIKAKDEAKKVLQGTGKDIREIGKQAAQTANDNKKLASSLSGVKTGYGVVRGAVSSFLSILGLSIGSMTTVSGLFGVIAVNTSNAGDKIAKMAQEYGIAADKLQTYRYAAELAGIDQDNLTNSISIFSGKIGDAMKGEEQSAKRFKQLGISLKNQDGTFKTTGVLLDEVADKFAQIEDPALKAALGQELFGRAGRKLQLLLSQGSAGINQYQKELSALGGVMSKDLLDQSEELNDNLFRVGTVVRGVRNAIAEGTIPIINNLITSFLSWYAANGELIRQNITKFVVNINNAFVGMISAIKDTLKVLTPLIAGFITYVAVVRSLLIIGTLVSMVRGLNFAFLALNASMILVHLSTKAVAAAQAALNAIMLLNPVGLVLAALAALVVAMVLFKDETINMAKALGASFAYVWNILEVTASRINKWFEGMAGKWNLFTEIGKTAFLLIGLAANDVLTNIRELMTSTIKAISLAIKGEFEEAAAEINKGFTVQSSPETIAALKKLKDDYNAVLYTPGVSDGPSFLTEVDTKTQEDIKALGLYIDSSGKALKDKASALGKDIMGALSGGDFNLNGAAADEIQKRIDSRKQEYQSVLDNVEALKLLISGEETLTEAAKLRVAAKQAMSKEEALLINQQIQAIRVQDQLNARYQKMQEINQQLAQSVGDVFKNIVSGGKSAKEVIADLASKFSDMLIQAAIVNPLQESLNKSGFNLFRMFGFAKGAAFNNGNVVPFASGGVVSRPTLFPMSSGKTGLMGEAGHEGILPLARTRSGDLGVQAQGMGSSTFVYSPSIQVSVTRESGQNNNRSEQDNARLGKVIDDAVKTAVQQVLSKEQRIGGSLNPGVQI